MSTVLLTHQIPSNWQLGLTDDNKVKVRSKILKSFVQDHTCSLVPCLVNNLEFVLL